MSLEIKPGDVLLYVNKQSNFILNIEVIKVFEGEPLFQGKVISTNNSGWKVGNVSSGWPKQADGWEITHFKDIKKDFDDLIDNLTKLETKYEKDISNKRTS